MAPASGYTVHTAFRREQTEDAGMVYVATYTVQDANGVRGEPVEVAGTFGNLEDALAAAQAAADKVLAQL